LLINTKLASISPLTSAAIRELGFEPTVEATVHTMRGIADAILSYHRSGS
jgi:uroporphyrinogen-III synthase